ncbi:MAG TPA: NHL repeat-containing protein, partial [Polyangiaceae bacterium]
MKRGGIIVAIAAAAAVGCGTSASYRAGTTGPVPARDGGAPEAGKEAGEGAGDADAGSDGGPATLSTLSLVAGEPGGLGNIDATGAAARFTQPWYAGDDAHGHLFLSDGASIRRFDEATGAVVTIAGTAFSAGNPGGFVDGVGPAAKFDAPSGVACDPGGTVYVADSGNSALRAVDANTGAVTTILRVSDVVAAGGPDHFTPVGIAYDGQSSLYVADFGYVASGGRPAGETGGAIYRATVAGGVTLLAGSPDTAPGFADGTGSAARFGHVRGVAFDGASTLYVADGCSIRKVDVGSGAVTTLAPTACLQLLYGLAYDGVGTLYAADGASVIRTVSTTTGAASTVAGKAGTYGAVDGVGPSAAFAAPTGVAFGADGVLRIADTGNFMLRGLTPSSSSVTSLAGAPSTMESADGVGTKARFEAPQGVASDGAGHVYVVDWSDDTVRRVDVATQAVTTLAGTPGTSGNADGTGAAARFYQPTWVAYDGAGRLYVSDSGNFAVRAIDVASGVVSTVASGGFVPEGLAVDKNGTLYVVDSAYSSIRRVDLTAGTTTVVAGSGGHGCGSTDGAGT